ncbi:hypothetical protein [Novipirellula aureliae]|nr:hypothetical protein [Novipirellula aureliae]
MKQAQRKTDRTQPTNEPVLCECCRARAEANENAKAILDQIDRDAEEWFQCHCRWEDLVREHGEEGAAIIADCY